MTKEKYLEMCDMMKKAPNPAEIPVELGDFPTNIQELFAIHNMLNDRWDGMSGSYLGKDLNLIPYLFDLYEVIDQKMSLYIINLIISINSRNYNDKLKRQNKASSKKGKK